MMSLTLLFLLISAATANTAATNTTTDTQPIVTRTFYQSVRTSQNAWPELMCSSKPESSRMSWKSVGPEVVVLQLFQQGVRQRTLYGEPRIHDI